MTRLLPIRAALFDLDGTLVESGPEIADAVNDTLRDFALVPIDNRTIEGWVGHGAVDLLTSVLSHALPCERSAVVQWPAYNEAMAVFRQHYAAQTGTRNRLYDGVTACLDRLRAADIAMAVVTNKDTAFAEKALEANGLSDFFAVRVCGDTLPSRKPDPSGVVRVLSALGVRASDAVFIGDSHVDVETARNAGLPVWAFSGGYNRGVPIREAAPDAVFDHWSEVVPLAGLDR